MRCIVYQYGCSEGHRQATRPGRKSHLPPATCRHLSNSHPRFRRRSLPRRSPRSARFHHLVMVKARHRTSGSPCRNPSTRPVLKLMHRSLRKCASWIRNCHLERRRQFMLVASCTCRVIPTRGHCIHRREGHLHHSILPRSFRRSSMRPHRFDA